MLIQPNRELPAHAAELKQRLVQAADIATLKNELSINRDKLVVFAINPFYARLYKREIPEGNSPRIIKRVENIRSYEKMISSLFSSQEDYANAFMVLQNYAMKITVKGFSDNGAIVAPGANVFWTSDGRLFDKKNRRENAGMMEKIAVRLSSPGTLGAFVCGMNLDACLKHAGIDIKRIFEDAGKAGFVAVNRLVSRNLWEF